MIGFWAFIIGLILAIVAGIFAPHNTVIILILLILGVIIGILNISDKESTPFLIATIALIVVGNVFTPITALKIGEYLGQILTLVAALMAPAAIIVAGKTLWAVGKPGGK
jgi:uncharacterized membrane protein